jgi:RimJ/RimL family protein N-acetyltransferase
MGSLLTQAGAPAAEDPRPLAEIYSRWSQDSEFWRLMTTYQAQMFSVWAIQKDIEKDLEKQSENNFPFQVRTLADDRLIGDVGLDCVRWQHGDCQGHGAPGPTG